MFLFKTAKNIAQIVVFLTLSSFSLTACSDNETTENHRLGQRYEKGQGVVQNYLRAFDLYTKAANKGHAAAQHDLGELYYHGHGVNQDYAKARQWYEKSAAQGYAKAKNNLARLLQPQQQQPQYFVGACANRMGVMQTGLTMCQGCPCI